MDKEVEAKFEATRYVEDCVFWVERLAILIFFVFCEFISVYVFDPNFCFSNFGVILLLFTNIAYASLFFVRQCIIPFYFEPDGLFYMERIAALLVGLKAFTGLRTLHMEFIIYTLTHCIMILNLIEDSGLLGEEDDLGSNNSAGATETSAVEKLEKKEDIVKIEAVKEDEAGAIVKNEADKVADATVNNEAVKDDVAEAIVKNEAVRDDDLEDNLLLEQEAWRNSNDDIQENADSFFTSLSDFIWLSNMPSSLDSFSNNTHGEYLRSAESIGSNEENEKQGGDTNSGETSHGEVNQGEFGILGKYAEDFTETLFVETASSECQRDLLDEYAQESIKWVVERKDLIAELNALTASYNQYKEKTIEAVKRMQSEWEKERLDMQAKIEDANESYQQLDREALELLKVMKDVWNKEKQDLEAQIDAAKANHKQPNEEAIEAFHQMQSGWDEKKEDLQAKHIEFRKISAEERLKWDEEKRELCAKLAAAEKHLEEERQKKSEDKEGLRNMNSAYQALEAQYAIDRRRWDEERKDYLQKYDSSTSWYFDEIVRWEEETKKLTSLVNDATTKAEYYKGCSDKTEETCRKLREENFDLCSKLNSKASLAQHMFGLVRDLEDKYRRLEEEKADLTVKLSAATASSELYKACLHDFGF